MRPDCEITEESLTADRHVVSVRGEIDYEAWAGARDDLQVLLTRVIEDEGRTLIALDLTGTTFLYEASSLIVSAWSRVRDAGGRFVVINIDPGIAFSFELSGVDQLLTIVATREEAIAALDDAASPS